MMAALSVAGVIGGIAFTIYLTQTLLAPLIEKATWFPENGLVGIVAWLLLYVVLALLVAPASLHKFISGVLFGFWGGLGYCIYWCLAWGYSTILADSKIHPRLG